MNQLLNFSINLKSFFSSPDFKIVAHTADCPVAAAENADNKLYAIQFHPEVLHSVEGTKMLSKPLTEMSSTPAHKNEIATSSVISKFR